MRRSIVFLLLFVLIGASGLAQSADSWRTATPDELSALLPTRAPVGKERIESEMRTASGIINARGQMIASVLLITAGYSAEGKFSHYLLTQHVMRIGGITLEPGAYVIGWTRADDGLSVHIYDASTITDRGTVLARPIAEPKRIESFRVWPPREQSYIQIGRYMLPYSLNR